MAKPSSLREFPTLLLMRVADYKTPMLPELSEYRPDGTGAITRVKAVGGLLLAAHALRTDAMRTEEASAVILLRKKEDDTKHKLPVPDTTQVQ